jgi:hypothetical protein
MYAFKETSIESSNKMSRRRNSSKKQSYILDPAYNIKERFVNLNRVTNDIVSNVGSDLEKQTFIIDTPIKSNITINVIDINSLVVQIMKLSSCIPHRTCALIYKINDNSTISLKIHPVTDAA